MDFNISLEREKEISKIKFYLSNGSNCVEFKKDNFSEIELFSLIHSQTFKIQNDIGSINIFKNDDEDISNVLKRINGAFKNKINIKNIEDELPVEIKHSQELDTLLLSNEIKHVMKENIQNINIFHYKSLKKFVVSIKSTDKGRLLDSTNLLIDDVDYHDGNLANIISDKLNDISQKLNKEFNIHSFLDFNYKSNRSIGLYISDKLSVLQNKKIETKITNHINSDTNSYYLMKEKIDSEYDEYIKNIKKNLVVFTDGGYKEYTSSSSFKILNADEEVYKESFLFMNLKTNYEEIGFLKGLEEALKIDSNKDIYIVSDYSSNYFLLESIKKNEDINTDLIYLNLYNNVKDLYNKTGKDITFISIKSHTNSIGYLFNGNRDVDKIATNTINIRYSIKAFNNNLDDIKKNNLKSFDYDKYLEMHIKNHQEMLLNSEYSSIITQKNLSFSRRHPNSTNSLFTEKTKIKGINYCFFNYFSRERELLSIVFPFRNKKDYIEKLDNFVIDVNSIKKIDNIKFMSGDTSIEKYNKDFIISETTQSSSIIKKFIKGKIVSSVLIRDHEIYNKEFIKVGLINKRKCLYKEQILGIAPKTKKIQKKKPQKIKIDNSFEEKNSIILDEDFYFGSLKRFPNQDNMQKNQDYLFIKLNKNDSYNVSFKLNNESYDYNIDNNEDTLLNINKYFKSFLQEKSKATENKVKNNTITILTNDNDIFAKIKKASNQEDFFNADMFQIMNRIYGKENYLCVSYNDLPKDIKSFKWLNDFVENEKNDFKVKKLKQRV